ncbi:MAG: hypothetical protein H7237_11860 [Alkalinema sp. FL-bin-369]|nr:hypothetical protein [Leptolyngbyaceae cyanobacterium LF-bin-369]
MDLNAARAKQRAAQQKAQTQPEGVARIGDRDPNSGSWYVQFPDGGIGANGIKTYTAASKPGDVVVMFPRPDGSIALDSEKGSPTIVPDVFNKPVPDAKKGGVWIFYRSAGKLWIGGHQAAPEEIATLSVVANSNDASAPQPSGYYVWGDKNGWVATFQVTERLPLIVDGYRSSIEQAINFYCISNSNRTTVKNVVRRMVGQSSTENIRNPNGTDTGELMSSHSVFPLGSGFLAFRSNVVPSVTPVGSGGLLSSGLADFAIFTFSGSIAASVGYLELGVAITESFEISHKNIYTRINNTTTERTNSSQYSFDGATRIPNVGVCQYKGVYALSDARVYSTQSILTYAIMCDRSATYYIRETVLASGRELVQTQTLGSGVESIVVAPSVDGVIPQRKYELFSSASAQVLSTNLSEPRFFGIRWDLRDFRSKRFFKPPSNASLITAFYNDPFYYFFSAPPFIGRLGSSDQGVLRPEPVYLGTGALPVGYSRRSRIQTPNAPPLLPVYDYDDGTPVTYSGGSVVQIPATEIVKATIGDGYLIRRVMEISGAFSTLRPIYCHAIPADAVILHWSTTADEP